MNQKIENQLQLALQTPEPVRAQTENLNVGFDSLEKQWEVIIKYHGNLDEIRRLGVVVEELIAGYAIMTISVNLVESVAEMEQIEYMEMPKRFFYGQNSGIWPREGSCIYPVTLNEPYLTGKGVLAAVLDSGIDYTKSAFRDADGYSRILFLWDQTIRPTESTKMPEMFQQGEEFDREQINRAISEEEGRGMWISGKLSTISSRDVSGHGTAVAGIFASSDITANMTGDLTGNLVENSLKMQDAYVGIAPETDLLVVKLGIPGENSFPRTTEIMKAVTYVINKALELERPLVINLSIGNTYGSHDGSALLERFLDNAAEIGKTVICVGSGNEGDAEGHVFGRVQDRSLVEFSIGEYERNISLQIWKNYSDEYTITLRSPGGREEIVSGRISKGKYEVVLEETLVLVYVGEPTPYSADQEIYLEFLPAEQSDREYINNGIWQIRMDPVRLVTGEYSMYLPSREARGSRSVFLRPTPEATFTIPSTASKVISVGAYDSTYRSYAQFSGRGYEETDMVARFAKGYGKPDLAAPGVNILAPDIYGGLGTFTGTSFATPIVSGAAALLMEWGIVKGNDPYLYGEKVKAYLIKGAVKLPGITIYPNARIGWGALCLEDSFLQ
jgi:subtilisin family serine protease